MPFGCLALRDGRTYNSISDITDKYEIGQVLRAKEFCELCLAKDRRTDKVYVCKKFLKKDGRKVRKAAKNEIMILKMVNHPNILQLIDTYETRKEYFIIQELATGGDVFDWILDQGNYTERDASNVIRQVLEAVAYLHSLNIVHRNLKLENLMYYTENNHKKVVLRDFYLSKFENGSITEPCGTPEYLAPEVVARHRYGRPVDCWAVGVIMFILLSGNPPFYDETEEENTDLHNRIIFCRIVAGEYEFDSPYWDDISPAAKELVCRLMEVDQMLRITAQDALWHEWIAGNGASEKNLKDGVCAQFEKNFAKAKWRKAIRVTNFLQRLRNPEALADSPAEAQRGDGGGVDESQTTSGETQGRQRDSEGEGTLSDLSLEVTVESRPADIDQEEEERRDMGVVLRREEEVRMAVRLSVGLSPSDIKEPPSQPSQVNVAPKPAEVEPDVYATIKVAGDGTRRVAANLGQNQSASESTQTPLVSPDPSRVPSSVPEPSLAPNVENKHTATTPDTSSRRKMAAATHGPAPTAPAANSAAAAAPPSEKRPATQGKEKDESEGSWCQTQLPEAVAERPVGVAVASGGVAGAGAGAGTGTGTDAGLEVMLKSDASPRVRRDRDARGTDRYSAEFSTARGAAATGPVCYSIGGSASLGRNATPYNPDVGAVGLGLAAGYGTPYSSLYASGGGMGMYGTGFDHHGGLGMGGVGGSGGHGHGATSDWQMDSVIEQIEKQMAAVLEKIEGDMPSLLEQISDCPVETQRVLSAHASPTTSRARSSHHAAAQLSTTPPPLPTSPRPPLPSLPHLTIPPPSYPPPSPPTGQAARDHEDGDREGQRGAAPPSSQSPRTGMGSRGL